MSDPPRLFFGDILVIGHSIILVSEVLFVTLNRISLVLPCTCSFSEGFLSHVNHNTFFNRWRVRIIVFSECFVASITVSVSGCVLTGSSIPLGFPLPFDFFFFLFLALLWAEAFTEPLTFSVWTGASLFGYLVVISRIRISQSVSDRSLQIPGAIW